MKPVLGMTLATTMCATLALSDPLDDAAFHRISESVFGPVIDEYNIPGLAIGVTYRGDIHTFTYGVADRATLQPVTPDTLFELGSVSKLFNVALAGLAEVRGLMSLDEPVSARMPDIAGGAFDAITISDLAAHATGGLPLQVPAQIRTDADLTRWLRDWTPKGDPQRIRSYSNLSMGLLGNITSEAFGSDYETALQAELLPALGLESTYVTVPEAAMPSYAFGYDRFGNSPVRVKLGLLDAEAYGMKSSLTDMILFLEAHLGLHSIPGEVDAALSRTRVAYYDTAHYAQAMVWEAYDWPVTAQELIAGNSTQMALAPQPITRRDAPPEGPIFLNKTGATNGFGAYVAMIPDEEIGVVVLANRNYPNPVRAEATLALITAILSAE